MKKLSQIAALLLSLTLVFSLLAACGPAADQTTAVPGTSGAPAPTQGNPDPTVPPATQPTEPAPAGDCKAEGEYLLDGAPLGMPMQWYLKIEKDGSFRISTARDYAADKGNGQVAEKDGTFVLVYSDSTNDAPKNATFSMKDGNLYFTSSVPIGTANMPGSEEAPFVAYCYANEELLGEYVTEYVSEGRMGTVLYDITLELQTGRRFLYTSVFTMSGTEYCYAETGSFELNGSELALTAYKKVTVATIESGELADIENPEPVKGTLENGVIKMPLLTSPMKSDRIDMTLEAATTSEAAGSYIGYKANERFTIDSVLKLGKNGKYTYLSDFLSVAMGGALYYEEGTFVFDENSVTLTPARSRMDDGELSDIAAPEANVLERHGLILAGKMPTGGMASSLTLTRNNIVGLFTASNADSAAEGSTIYTPQLEMRGDASFTLTVLSGLDVPYVAEGTFEAEEGMITFIYEEGAARFIAMLSGNSFNAKNVPLNEEGDEESFVFTKGGAPEVSGTYAGSHTTQSGMGTTVYTIKMVLNPDGSYRFTSEFTMGDTTYVSAEEGRYAVDGEKISFKALQATTMATIESGEMSEIAEADQEVLEGTLSEGVLQINRKASCMARSTVDLSLTLEVPEEPAMP